MALKKTHAGYFKHYEIDIMKDVEMLHPETGAVVGIEKVFSHKENRSDWIEQRDVDMHPLEEAAMIANWDMHKTHESLPVKPSQEDEHEWLIEHGASYVKQKRTEWKDAYDAAQPDFQKAHDKFQEAHKAWCDHAELCVLNERDPDTFEGDARKSLTIPGRKKDAVTTR